MGDGDDHDDQNDGAHEDHEPERVGWLVLAPVLAVLLVAPPALGAFAVDRVSRVEVSAGTLFEPLEAGAEPRSMALLEFMQRAGDRDGQSFSGAMVELTGFVAGGDGPGFDLARYSIACCAADAAVAVVSVLDNGPAPARDRMGAGGRELRARFGRAADPTGAQRRAGFHPGRPVRVGPRSVAARWSAIGLPSPK